MVDPIRYVSVANHLECTRLPRISPLRNSLYHLYQCYRMCSKTKRKKMTLKSAPKRKRKMAALGKAGRANPIPLSCTGAPDLVLSTHERRRKVVVAHSI